MSLFRISLPACLNAETIAAVQRNLHQVEDDASLRLVLLEGTTDVFCRGLDPNLFTLENEMQAGAVRPAVEGFAALLRKIYFFPKPVLAEVTGEAIGGGLGLAAACDIVVASDSALFGLPEMIFDIIPAMITPILLQRMLPQKLRALCLCGHTIDAVEAKTLGLADFVVPGPQLPKRIRDLSRQLTRPKSDTISLWKHWLADAAVSSAARSNAATTAISTAAAWSGAPLATFAHARASSQTWR